MLRTHELQKRMLDFCVYLKDIHSKSWLASRSVNPLRRRKYKELNSRLHTRQQTYVTRLEKQFMLNWFRICPWSDINGKRDCHFPRESSEIIHIGWPSPKTNEPAMIILFIKIINGWYILLLGKFWSVITQ